MLNDERSPNRVGGERGHLYAHLLDAWESKPRWYQRAVCRQLGTPTIGHATTEQLQQIETMLAGCHTP